MQIIPGAQECVVSDDPEKAACIKEWTKRSRLYGNPGTSGGVCSNIAYNIKARHGLFRIIRAAPEGLADLYFLHPFCLFLAPFVSLFHCFFFFFVEIAHSHKYIHTYIQTNNHTYNIQTYCPHIHTFQTASCRLCSSPSLCRSGCFGSRRSQPSTCSRTWTAAAAARNSCGRPTVLEYSTIGILYVTKQFTRLNHNYNYVTARPVLTQTIYAIALLYYLIQYSQPLQRKLLAQRDSILLSYSWRRSR